MAALIGALADKDGKVRVAAAAALGRIGDARAIEPLTGVLGADLELRSAAACALGELGELGESRAIEPLLKIFQSDVWVLIDEVPVVESLGRSRDARAVEPLVSVLRHRYASPKVQRVAVKALGQLGDSRAMPSLLGLLENKDPGLRREAAHALAEFVKADPERLRAVWEHCGGESKYIVAKAVAHANWGPASPQECALQAVVQRKWSEAVSLGPAALEPLTWAAWWDEDRFIRMDAIRHLARFRDPSVLDALSQACQDYDSGVREVAWEAIFELIGAATLGLLSTEPRPDVKASGMKALERVRNRQERR